jgi:hypothetical protein
MIVIPVSISIGFIVVPACSPVDERPQELGELSVEDRFADFLDPGQYFPLQM